MRVDKLSETPTFTASTDNYLDLGSNGVYTYIVVANLAVAPAVTTNSMRMFKIVTNATAITTVTDLRVLGLTISKQSNISGTQLSATSAILGTQLSSTAGISGTQLSNHQNYNKSSIANPSATATTNGTAVTLLPPTGFMSLFPSAGIDVVFGGTFGAETVTATVKATYSDATTVTAIKTATAARTAIFTNADIRTLIKDGLYIQEIDVYSQSSIASSVATVTFNHAGFYQ